MVCLKCCRIKCLWPLFVTGWQRMTPDLQGCTGLWTVFSTFCQRQVVEEESTGCAEAETKPYPAPLEGKSRDFHTPISVVMCQGQPSAGQRGSGSNLRCSSSTTLTHSFRYEHQLKAGNRSAALHPLKWGFQCALLFVSGLCWWQYLVVGYVSVAFTNYGPWHPPFLLRLNSSNFIMLNLSDRM